jgi:hypothetical protein
MLNMQSPKILIFLAVWRRPEITEVCFMGINRLRSTWNIDALAVISEESMIPLCEKYGIRWCMHENEPLGRKKNYGISQALKLDFDFMMEIGSDDLILDELLRQYAKFFPKYDFFGICDAAYINAENLDCRRLQSNSTYGAGRIISRKALEAMEAKLWKDNLSKGLDNRSLIELYKKGFKYWQIPPIDYPLVIDIKSPVNIWPFNYMTGVSYDIDILFSHLSEQEVNAIKCLPHLYQSAGLIER